MRYIRDRLDSHLDNGHSKYPTWAQNIGLMGEKKVMRSASRIGLVVVMFLPGALGGYAMAPPQRFGIPVQRGAEEIVVPFCEEGEFYEMGGLTWYPDQGFATPQQAAIAARPEMAPALARATIYPFDGGATLEIMDRNLLRGYFHTIEREAGFVVDFTSICVSLLQEIEQP